MQFHHASDTDTDKVIRSTGALPHTGAPTTASSSGDRGGSEGRKHA
jgi:hypothetical protein